MKVLISAYQCVPGSGSELGNGWNWAVALSELGNDVTILTSARHRAAAQSGGPHGIKFRFVESPASPLRRLSPRLAIYDGYLRFQDAALRQMEARPEQYDIAHHVAWGSLHLGSRLWRQPMPLLYGPIGGGQTAPAAYWRYFGRDWPAETLRTAATGALLKLNGRSRETLRHAAVTLVTNSATAAACQRMGARDIRYMLAEGVPGDWITGPRERPGGLPVVLWVGRMLPRKAPVLAVEAFAGLRRAMPARMIMAGDGPMRPHVRTAIGRLGLTADVDLPGQVPWDEVRRLCDSASVFLFTSLRDSSGSQFLEALGRGLPAVALDHHGIGDVDVGAAAVKVPLPPDPHDLPGQLAAALQAVLCDSEWETRSALGIEWAGEHVWSAKAAAATEIYREIVGIRA
jgi:glycosyltransferase involved in cell wall biosynthesis